MEPSHTSQSVVISKPDGLCIIMWPLPNIQITKHNSQYDNKHNKNSNLDPPLLTRLELEAIVYYAYY